MMKLNDIGYSLALAGVVLSFSANGQDGRVVALLMVAAGCLLSILAIVVRNK